MYKVIRAVLFRFDPERVHYFSMNALRVLCGLPAGKKMISRLFRPKPRTTSFAGIDFANPVGLGAGFDKNARWLDELEALGFGFVEIGTVTPQPQAGNERPRLFRLQNDQALVNRMGFNNEGAARIAERLKGWRERVSKTHAGKRLIVGGNIGKNKLTPNENAWQDYLLCFRALKPYVDYFVVNVSSPNTPGLRELQEKASLRQILTCLQDEDKKYRSSTPILLKIAPDLTHGQLDDVIALALEVRLNGLVVANTTTSRDALQTPAATLDAIGAGGLSGRPLLERSTDLLRYIHEQTRGSIPLVGSGGVFTGKDAQEKLAAGATLLQVWTGFVYEGPSIVKRICETLAAAPQRTR